MKNVPALICFILLSAFAWGQRGIDGPLTVSSTVTVNEYTVLSANALAGNTSITVANSNLNTHNRFVSALSAGDLVMIIQMQGATIKGHDSAGNPGLGAPNDSTWGAIVNYNNCGNYEFKQVATVPSATTITFNCPIHYNYTASGKVQIVRIPRYTTLTINNGGTISCDAWDSAVGGMVAIEVANNTVINAGGSINASQNGFRGGLLESMNPVLGTTYFTVDNQPQYGGLKGESIGGYMNDYDPFGGGIGRAAPANGGGGGDAWNSAGGGGANGGNIAGWINGYGIPDISQAGYITAWNQEYTWMSAFVGSGGGRGGYTWCADYLNPQVAGPGNQGWGYDYRRSVGGRGGRPLDYSTGRLFLGGGGGAGQEDNNNGGAGGNGGGMIYLISYGTVSGSGLVIANGQDGGSDLIHGPGDGSGGGGAGGTIIINSTGNISGISIEANGGNGGNQSIASIEAEGPGGGGGGGYIGTTNGITSQVSPGVNGTTTSIPTFPPNGSTKGSAGTIDSVIHVININCCSLASLSISASKPSICPCDSTTVIIIASDTNKLIYSWSPGGQTTETIHVKPCSTTIFSVSVTDTNGIGCVLSDTIKISVNSLSNINFSGDTAICIGQKDTLRFSGGASYKWSTGATTSSIIVNPSVSTTYTATAYGLCDSLHKLITVNVLTYPNPNIKWNDSVCFGTKDTISVNGGSTYLWSNGTTGTTYILNNVEGDSTVSVELFNGKCYIDTTVKITVKRLPSSFVTAQPVCVGECTVLTATPGEKGYVYSWNNGATTDTTTVCPVSDSIFSLTVSNTCGKVISTATVTVYSPSIFACCDTLINQGDTAILNASLSSGKTGSVKYKWVPANGLNCDTCQYVIATPTVTTTYTVTGTSTDGCRNITEVTVTIEMLCFNFTVPNVFTPNGDGINDEFAIKSKDLDKYSITIYDRWGRIMNTSTNPSQSWNGNTESGNKASDGVYYYIITATCQGNNYKKNGFLQLIR